MDSVVGIGTASNNVKKDVVNKNLLNKNAPF